MPNQFTPGADSHEEILASICGTSAKLILQGKDFVAFRAQLAGMTPILLDAFGIPLAQQHPETIRSFTTHLALEIWNATPVPDNRFRPRKIPKPERNASCPCGSGQKFKQCCSPAQTPPSLGISEELMLSVVLATLPQKTLLALPLPTLPPEALAMVASGWIDDGQPKKAIALLEQLFTHLDQLDERAEFAADTLLNAYLEVNSPRKKQKFIDTLKTAPDKTLRSTGWQRQATVFCDRGDFAAAWLAFTEAQRLTPNDPALSHLEVLMLVSEGRRGEAKARAKFWAQRLGRDARYDHGELIETLLQLADDSDDSLLATLPLARGPLPLIGQALAGWPEPACHYSLKHGELTPAKALAVVEDGWLEVTNTGDLDATIAFLGAEALAGQSFVILRDTIGLVGALTEYQPASADALARQLLKRSEALRLTVLGKLKALASELSWGCLDNRPLLTLVAYYIDEFSVSHPEQTLDLLRWSVNTANPNDNQGLRSDLIHRLIAAGLANEAIAVGRRYPDDFLVGSRYGSVLAMFAAGRLAEAEILLLAAREKCPKVWKMLLAAKPKKPRPKNPGYITVGGDDEAYEYREHHLDLWRSTGALSWAAAIKSGQAARLIASPCDEPNGSLF